MNLIKQMKNIIFILLLTAGIILNFKGFNLAQAATDCTVQTDIPQAECEALIAFYNATDGPNWSDSPGNGWNQNNSPGTWDGLTVAGGNILMIGRESKNLKGNIPSLIALPGLLFLYLNDNQLSGTIPDLSALTALQDVNLSNNQLSGNIPASLSSLVNMARLRLSDNLLEGTIPDLTRLTKLWLLDLSNNRLSGPMPALNTLKDLKEIHLDNNQLSGTIPDLSQLSILEKLNLNNNQLTGSIPANLNTLTTLTELNLFSNQLSGEIPDLSALNALPKLNLSNNQLTGSIPANLNTLTALTELDLSANQLTGTIPANLNTLTHLQSLKLQDNQLNGNIPALNSLTSLEHLWLYDNKLEGVIPDLSGLTSLQSIQFQINRLSGTIPDLSALTDLQKLDLSYNQLSGSIPSSISKVTVLDLTNNKITIPDEFLNEKWARYQTVPPTELNVTPLSPNSVQLNWTSILYMPDGSYYRIKYAAAPGGPYTDAGTTTETTYEVTGLSPGIYYFVVETFTPAKGNQQSDLISELKGELEFEFSGMPEISVKQPDDTEIPLNGKYDFGTALLGTPVFATFTVENTGNADLILTEPITLPEGFTLSKSFGMTTVSPSASTTFEVQLNDALGTFEGAISFANNDSDENPYAFTISGTVKPKPEPEISLSCDSSDVPDGGSFSFGEVVIANPITKTFTISNSGTAALTVASPSIPDGFSLVGAFPETIAVGESAEFQLRLTAAAVGAFKGEFQFDTNDSDENPYQFTVTGTVKPEPEPEIAVSADSINIPDGGSFDFGQVVIGTPITKSFTITNTGTAALTVNSIDPIPNGFSRIGAFPNTIAAGGSGSFQLQLDAKITGSFEGIIQFDTNDKDENPYNFSIKGKVNPEPEPEIAVFDGNTEIPNNGGVDFGSTLIALAVNKTFTVKNTGTDVLNLSDILLPTGFTLLGEFPNRIAAGEADSFQIRFDASSEGTFSGTLEFDTNDRDENPFKFTLRGTVNPEAVPEIDVLDIPNKGSVSFGTTVVGKAIVKTFTIRNIGTAALTVAFTHPTPEGFSRVGLFPDTIAAGDSASFQIQLNAEIDGTFSGIFEFDTNDKDENPYRFTLTGTVNIVTEPEIEVWEDTVEIPDAGKLNFGVTDVGSPVIKSITIKNTGTAILELGKLNVPEGFSLVGTFPKTIAVGGSDSFRIRLDADADGKFIGTLRFATNDLNENPYNFTLKGIVNPEPEPEIEIWENNIVIPDSGSITFGNTVIGGSAIVKSFTIKNTGTAELTLDSLTLPKGFSLTGNFPDRIPAGSEDIFQIRFYTDQVGVFEGTLWFNTNDSDENPYNFTVKGAVNPEPASEIEVFDGSIEIPDSGTVNFGATIFGLPLTKAFTLKNTGTAVLTIGNLELPDGFEAVGDFPATVAAGQSSRFQVRLKADRIAIFEGTLRFDTNDANENPYNFTVKGAVNPEPEPEIELWDDGTEIPNNDTVSLGTTTVGVSAAKIFTVRNTGMGDLNLTEAELPEGFSLVGTFPASIAAWGTDEFQIRLDAAAVGTYSGIFRFYTNDRDESPYSITISGAVNPQQEPEIEVSDNGKDIPDGGANDFGTTVTGISLTKTFTIKNTGSGLLNLGNLELPEGFSLSDTFPKTVAAQGSDSFQIRLDASTVGVYDGILRFVTNDGNENPYDIRITAEVLAETAPEIALSDKETDIPNRGIVNFNSTTIAVTKTFTIRNTGTAVLTLSDLRVPEDFVLLDTFPERIAPDGADSFQIRFMAATIGDFEGILRFDTNDKDENPYEFTLKGKVLPKPEPEIEVIENDMMIPNGGAVNFGSTTTGTSVMKTFMVRNTGTAALTLSNLDLPDSCSLISTFPNTVAAGGADSFQIQFDADTVGAFEGLIELGTNDSDESHFYVTFFATVLPEPLPEIELWENNVNIPVSANLDFGKTHAGMPVIKTFTVKNTGEAALTLGDIELPEGFEQVGAFPRSLVPGGTDHFQIRLTASASGVFTGSFQFDTNDADENPYKLIIKGVVNAAPTIIGQYPITISEDTQLSDILDYLIVSDPDNLFPDDFTLTVREGKNYTLSPLVADIRNTTAIVAGDIDKDGDIDLITGNDGAPGRLYLNNGTADPFRGAVGMDIASDSYHTRSLVLGDIDGDGDLDLIAGNDGRGNRLYLNDAEGNLFKDLIGINVNITTDNYRTQSLALGDIDGDGDLDLIAGNESAPNRLYINNGSPNPFRDMQGRDITSDRRHTRSLVLGDIDGDGDSDLIVGNDGEPNRLYLNNGAENPFEGISGMDISEDSYSTHVLVLSDVDSDGDLDLIVGNDKESNRLYLNKGSGNPFDGVIGKEITTDSRHTRSLVLGDVDGDGDSDLIVGNEGEPSRLYLNNGSDNPFDSVAGTRITNSEHTASLILTDADKDGDLDLIGGNTDSSNRLYLNNGTENPFENVVGKDIGMATDANATTANAVIPAPDFNGMLTVPITVHDGMDESNVFDLDVRVEAVNDPPVITGQNPLTTKQKAFATTEGTALTFSLMDLTVADPDNRYPDDFTLKLQKGENYTVDGTAIIPAPGFTGILTVPAAVHDGSDESNLFDLEVIVAPKEKPKNEAPVITGQKSLTISSETSLTISLDDLSVTDPDNRYPDDFTLTVLKGDNYEVSGNTVIPASGFSATLKIPVIVSDGADESPVFHLIVSVRFDSDGDGMPDHWEMKFGLDSAVNDAEGDLDKDGYSNLEEYLYGTDPTVSHSVPQIPLSRAGEDQTVEEGTTVILDGTASTSPNGIILYSWVQTKGIPAALSDTSDPKPNFVTPCVDSYGSVLTFELTVTDGKDFQASDEVNIFVRDNGITEFPDDVLSFITATGDHAGIRLIEGGNIVGLYTIHSDNIPETKDKPNSLLYGLIEIHIKVADKGDNAVAVIYLPTPAPNDYRWYQYDSTQGWSDLGAIAVFNDRRDQITLTLTDGGTGDGDGLADGFITGIYGLGTPSVEISEDGGGGCFISSTISGISFRGVGFVVFVLVFMLTILVRQR